MKTFFMNNLSKLVFPALILSYLVSCTKSDDAAESSGKPQAVATIGMVADIVRNVAGDRLAVSSLVGEGIDPHLYKPTSTDVKSLQSADIIFYNGLHLEGKMGDIL
ncbi:MAG: zinc ABC transporter substrate-binding protein, partial [Verrucomicrobiales bacterium]|nr:zinc ABC transporter substrate-binding protein [Verrucomicrobiales bacterium]